MWLFYTDRMNETLLELKNISKRYGKQQALTDVSFAIKKGHIYGFVGENGAGKTTTLRIITGLSKQTSGTVEYSLNGNKKPGCMIEGPVFDGFLNAAENLKLHAMLYGVKDFSNIPQVLERTGLGNVGNKKVRNFSMGMKQRLGIAAAMISNPELLILDEPVNGLDPLGMIAVRKLLSSLNKDDGITILLSSHILSELQELATDYIFISGGKILNCVSAADVLAGGQSLEQYYLGLFSEGQNE